MILKPVYMLLIVLPFIGAGLYIQNHVKKAYIKFSRKKNKAGYTGLQVAHSILEYNNVHNVVIREIRGVLSDNYIPFINELRLSEQVYETGSITSACIAAHECEHAIQDKHSYIPLKVRNVILPVVNFGNIFIWPLIIIGFLTGLTLLIDIGIILFISIVWFHLITLPVEINASKQAIATLYSLHILSQEEIPGARKVLTAVALTYIVSPLIPIMNLVCFLFHRHHR